VSSTSRAQIKPLVHKGEVTVKDRYNVGGGAVARQIPHLENIVRINFG
jgi:hypothetical protein